MTPPRRRVVLRAHNRVRAWGYDAAGRLVWRQTTRNLVVDLARPYLADLIREAPVSTAIRAVAIGTDGTVPDVVDTQLGAELARKPLPVPGTDTASERNVQIGAIDYFRQTFGPGVVGTVREFAFFGDLHPGVVLSDVPGVPPLRLWLAVPGEADAGRLFVRGLIGPYALDGSNTLIVEDALEFQAS